MWVSQNKMQGKNKRKNCPQLHTNKPAPHAGEKVRVGSQLCTATNSGFGHLFRWATPRLLATNYKVGQRPRGRHTNWFVFVSWDGEKLMLLSRPHVSLFRSFSLELAFLAFRLQLSTKKNIFYTSKGIKKGGLNRQSWNLTEGVVSNPEEILLISVTS